MDVHVHFREAYQLPEPKDRKEGLELRTNVAMRQPPFLSLARAQIEAKPEQTASTRSSCYWKERVASPLQLSHVVSRFVIRSAQRRIKVAHETKALTRIKSRPYVSHRCEKIIFSRPTDLRRREQALHQHSRAR